MSQWSPLRIPSCASAPAWQPPARWAPSSASTPALCTGPWTACACPAAATGCRALTPWASPWATWMAPSSSLETTWCAMELMATSWPVRVSTWAVSGGFSVSSTEFLLFHYNFSLYKCVRALQCLQKSQLIYRVGPATRRTWAAGGPRGAVVRPTSEPHTPSSTNWGERPRPAAAHRWSPRPTPLR